MSISINKQYWVLTKFDHEDIIGEKEYNSLELCTFKHIVEKDGETQYCFYPNVDKTEHYVVCGFGLPNLVYECKEDYLVFLVKYVTRLNEIGTQRSNNFYDYYSYYEFDDFIRRKIKESQQRSPEKWI